MITDPSQVAALRFTISFSLLVVFGLAEAMLPRAPRSVPRRARWPANLGVTLLDALLVRVLLPSGAVGFGLLAERRGWGLLNSVDLPAWVELGCAVVVLDLALYGQHALFHHVPPLWRLHRMHHADVDLDVTTGTRFHPIEILLSFVIKFGVVVAIGAGPLAVLVFEILLNASSLFNHSNLCLPPTVDRALRRVIVTPDMHRVHHSIERAETDSNFGFNLPWWDWLFGTYRASPAAGYDAMTIGVAGFRDPRELRLLRMLIQPFRRPPQSPAPPRPAHERATPESSEERT